MFILLRHNMSISNREDPDQLASKKPADLDLLSLMLDQFENF